MKLTCEQAKSEQFEALKKLKDVCEDNGLSMWLYAGSLLGAVRHKGRIPWDDDIDVIMPFSDLLELQSYGSKKLGEFELSTPENGFVIDSTAKFGKSSLYTFDNKNDEECGRSILAGIDVFSFIEVDKKTYRFLDEYKRFIRKLKLDGAEEYGISEQSRLAHLSYFNTLKSIDGKYDTGIVYDCLANRYRGWTALYKKSWFNSEELEYDGESFMCGEHHRILNCLYGDGYMTPKKTHTHYFAKNVHRKEENV